MYIYKKLKILLKKCSLLTIWIVNTLVTVWLLKIGGYRVQWQKGKNE